MRCVVGERGDAAEELVQPVGELGRGAAPVGEVVGQGEEDGVHVGVVDRCQCQ